MGKLMPAASTALRAKMNNGSISGRVSSMVNKLPPRAPEHRALPNRLRQLIAGRPMTNVRARVRVWCRLKS